jgi:hypothetical protein
MSAEICGLDEIDPWIHDGKAVRRPGAHEFFRVQGLKVRSKKGAWNQPAFIGEGGFIALLRDETQWLLVQLKPEPGNPVIDTPTGTWASALAGPSIQCSRTNKQLHSPAIPLIRHWKNSASTEDPDKLPNGSYWVPGDGARQHHKRNEAVVLDVTRKAIDDELIATGHTANFAWVTLEVLRLIVRRGLANSHLHEVMSFLV